MPLRQTGLNTGSHDLPVSPALDAFMGTRWAATPSPPTNESPATTASPAATPASPPPSPASG